MKKKEWLLLAVGDSIEPIQLQKALFKFSKETGVPAKETYNFEPYNWGPCSFEIYDDLRRLRDEGLLEFAPSGRGWNVYRLTEAGRLLVSDLRTKANATFLKGINVARQFVTSRDFSTLLKDTYSQYPEFAAKSLFNG